MLFVREISSVRPLFLVIFEDCYCVRFIPGVLQLSFTGVVHVYSLVCEFVVAK